MTAVDMCCENDVKATADKYVCERRRLDSQDVAIRDINSHEDSSTSTCPRINAVEIDRC